MITRAIRLFSLSVLLVFSGLVISSECRASLCRQAHDPETVHRDNRFFSAVDLQGLKKEGFALQGPTGSLFARFHRQELTEADRDKILETVLDDNLSTQIKLWPTSPFEARLYELCVEHLQSKLRGPIRQPEDLVPLIRFAMRTDSFWRRKAQPLYETPYGQILQYFDIKTLALLHRGETVKDIPNLRYVKKATERLVARRAQISIPAIQTVDDFMVAVGVLLGKKTSFRDQDVIMTSEVPSDQDHLLSFDAATRQELKSNRFLKTVDAGKVGRKTSLMQVEYASIATLQKIVKENRLSLPDQLRQELFSVEPSEDGDYESAEHRRIYRDVLKEIVSQLILNPGMFNGKKVTDLVSFNRNLPYNLYRIFMSLHPLADGNGRSGRLFYEVIGWRWKELLDRKVELPIFDLDLMAFEDSEKLLILGSFLRSWVSKAQNDIEFLERADLALRAMVIMYPQMKILFPEIGGAHEASRKKNQNLPVADGGVCRGRAKGLFTDLSNHNSWGHVIGNLDFGNCGMGLISDQCCTVGPNKGLSGSAVPRSERRDEARTAQGE